MELIMKKGAGGLRMRRNDDVCWSTSRNSSSAASLTMRTVRYGECQKNHAAGIGGYAVDGCREFMPSADDGSVDSAMACAACGCHRNFHRRLLETHHEVTCSNSSCTDDSDF